MFLGRYRFFKRIIYFYFRISNLYKSMEENLISFIVVKVGRDREWWMVDLGY